MSSDYKTLLKYFFTWRVALFLIAILSAFFIPKFGARFPYYDSALEVTGLPNWIWGFGNFDGVHYLRIAQKLYADVNTQAFFPLFPLLIRFFAFVFPKTNGLDLRIFVDPSYFYSGIILSNVFFLSAIFVLYKLFSLDSERKTVLKSMLLLLIFPTAYYFGSIYTESLFLLLSATSFLFLRKKNFLLASIFISLATAARINGFLLIVPYAIEAFREKMEIKRALGFFVAPLGVLLYMYYLKVNFSNPLYFITSQANFGANRLANGIIFLPQVFYRYLRIFVSVPVFSLSFFIASLEAIFTISSITVSILFYKKMRFSYWVFTLSTLVLPTLTGTLLSMPRFMLGAFLLLPFLARSKYYSLISIVFTILSVILLSMFIRGHWVA